MGIENLEDITISKHAIERLKERSGYRKLTNEEASNWMKELLAQSKEEELNRRSSRWGRSLRQRKHTTPARYFVISKYRLVVIKDGDKYVVRTIEPK